MICKPFQKSLKQWKQKLPRWTDPYRCTASCFREKKEEQQSKGEIETHHPAYLGAQDTYYVGYIKGVGKIISKPLSIPIAV